MKRTHLEKMVDQLDGMIAALGQAVVFGTSKQEDQAKEHLLDARLKLIEQLEKMPRITRDESSQEEADWLICTTEDLVTSEIWHVDQKSQEQAEYYLVLKDAGLGRQIPVILSVQYNPYLQVSSSIYSPADYDYTIHDFCDHENGDCQCETAEYQHQTYLDDVARRLNILDGNLKIIKVIERISRKKQDA